MHTVEEALEALGSGRMIVVVDDADRENEGDLLLDARFANAEAINFMIRYGRGLVCMPMEEQRLKELGLAQMVSDNTDRHGTAFTVSVDYQSTSTGISAAERAATTLALLDPHSSLEDFRRPGHLFPLAARTGGVLVRRGHTEAAVDLVRLSRPQNDTAAKAALICEIIREDGQMARQADLETFCQEHRLCMISIAQVVHWRRAHEQLVVRVATTRLPTRYGEFTMYGFTELYTDKEHIALSMGDIADGQPVLCRVHSECLTGDALGSARCDCGEQYDAAMRRIAEAGRGCLVYLRQEGRGIGLINKLKAYALQDGGLDTVDANLHLGLPADQRDYHVGAQILKNLGVRQLRLMSNNPAKISGLEQYGISIAERLPLQIAANRHNQFYLHTKQQRMRHQLETVTTPKLP